MIEILILILLQRLLSEFGNRKKICDTSKLQVTIITPPVVRKAISFPVIAAITNTYADKRIILHNATWYWNGIKFEKKLTGELKPCGNEERMIRSYRSRVQHLNDEEAKTLKMQYEKVARSTRYIRFTVTGEMAEELLSNGSAKLTLSLNTLNAPGVRNGEICKTVVLKAGQVLESPQVPQGTYEKNLFIGDTHSHSTYTWDYYFGNGIYTIQELKSLAMAAGLNWLTLTDHSYCLDAGRYEEQRREVNTLSDSEFAFLYGEELSCAELVNGKKANDTCHCNGILNSAFVPSTTDVFRKASSPDSQQGINSLKQNGGLAIINHPKSGTGIWEAWNFNINTYPYTHGETGMEIINAALSHNDNRGSTLRWVDQRLLRGEKVFPFAGSDTESANHLGECYTAVFADHLSQKNIKTNLEEGHHFISTGPGLAMWVREKESFQWSWMGDTIAASCGMIEVYVSYCNNEGEMYIWIMKGKAGWSEESEMYSLKVDRKRGYVKVNINVETGCYVRAYCRGINNESCRAYTTPVWID